MSRTVASAEETPLAEESALQAILLREARLPGSTLCSSDSPKNPDKQKPRSAQLFPQVRLGAFYWLR